jgi:hypothetical protein
VVRPIVVAGPDAIMRAACSPRRWLSLDLDGTRFHVQIRPFDRVDVGYQ